jgi:hypothetical protein
MTGSREASPCLLAGQRSQAKGRHSLRDQVGIHEILAVGVLRKELARERGFVDTVRPAMM